MLALQHRLFGGNRIQWRAQDIDRIAKRFSASTHDLAGMMLPHRGGSSGPASAEVARDVGGKTIAEATFIISTNGVDSYGDTINQDGWNLKRFASNPVVLWAHDGHLLPIGKAVKTWLNGGKLKSTVSFDSDRFSQKVAGMVQRDMLRATSVGFRPGEWEFSKDPKRPYGIDFKTGHELCEWSIVAIPANKDCLLVSIASESKTLLNDVRAAAHALREEIKRT